MNQRDFHLTFCTDCTNRLFDSNQGLICALTQEQANFSNICSDYVIDFKERERKTNTLTKQIKESYSTNKIIGHFDSRGTYEQIEIDKYEEFPKTKKYPKRGLGVLNLVLSLSALVYIIFVNELPISLAAGPIIIYGFLTIMLTSSVWLIFDRKQYFTWTDYYMKLKDNKIYFNDILFFGRAKAYTTGIASDKFIVATKTKGLVVLETLALDGISPEQIGKLIKEKHGLTMAKKT